MSPHLLASARLGHGSARMPSIYPSPNHVPRRTALAGCLWFVTQIPMLPPELGNKTRAVLHPAHGFHPPLLSRHIPRAGTRNLHFLVNPAVPVLVRSFGSGPAPMRGRDEVHIRARAGRLSSPCHPSVSRGQLVQNRTLVAFATRRAPRRKKKCERRETHFRSG